MKLATAQRILKIEDIDGADFLQKASLLGWQIVVKKEEFKVGDLVCYIAIDSIVPEKEEFEFLRERNFRIRSIKLRKVLSQGLIIPLPKGNWKEGADLTEILGIKKYEKIDNNPRQEKLKVPKTWWKKYLFLFKHNILFKMFPFLVTKNTSKFPSDLVPKTDEERIQFIPYILEKHKNELFYVSYKLDGSSGTFIHEKRFGVSKFRICSRNLELHDKKNDWYITFKACNLDLEILKLVQHFKTDNIIVQGECVGKFNGNHHSLKENKIFLFNIFVDGVKLNPKQFKEVCTSWSIPHCPLHSKVELNHTMEDILKVSQIKDVFNSNVPAEGLVWRNETGTVSFKVINNEFLIKKGE